MTNTDAACITTQTHVESTHTSNRVYATDRYTMHLQHCSSVSAQRVHFVLVGNISFFYRMHIFTRASARDSSKRSKVDWRKKKRAEREEESWGDCPRCPVHAVSTRSSLESAEGHGILACHRCCQPPGVAGACGRPLAPSATPPDSRRPPRTPQRSGVAGSRSASPHTRRPTGAAAAEERATRDAAGRRGGPRVRRAPASPALPSVPRAAPECAHCVPTPTLSPCPG